MSRCPDCGYKHECAEWCGESNEELFDRVCELMDQLETLKQYYRESQGVVGFYGDTERWYGNVWDKRDVETVIFENGLQSDNGGKRAREFQNSELNKKAREICND